MQFWYLKILILSVAIVICCESELFSQVPGSPLATKNALELAHKPLQRELPKYDSIVPLKQHIYIYGGAQKGSGWNVAGMSSNTFKIGTGYRITPIHAIEASMNYYRDRADRVSIYRGKGDDFGLDLGYAFNLSTFGSRSLGRSRYEFLFLAGLTSKFGEGAYGVYNGFRGGYTFFRNMTLFVEPRLTFKLANGATAESSTVATTFAAGLNFTLFNPDFYIYEEAMPLAIKTNLLYDAIGALNIGFEIPINYLYSVTLDYLCPWYGNSDNHRYYRLWYLNAEGRVWFGSDEKRESKRLLTGWFAGVGFGGGAFDLMRDKNSGFQGTFLSIGGTMGYAHKLYRNLNMEYSVGYGLLYTKYYKYRWDGFEYALKYPSDTYFRLITPAPTKVSVSLVWLLDYNK